MVDGTLQELTVRLTRAYLFIRLLPWVEAESDDKGKQLFISNEEIIADALVLFKTHTENLLVSRVEGEATRHLTMGPLF